MKNFKGKYSNYFEKYKIFSRFLPGCTATSCGRPACLSEPGRHSSVSGQDKSFLSHELQNCRIWTKIAVLCPKVTLSSISRRCNAYVDFLTIRIVIIAFQNTSGIVENHSRRTQVVGNEVADIPFHSSGTKQ